jgi:hypothetical protein
MLKIVVMSDRAGIEEAPARWIDRITKSIAGPGCRWKRRVERPSSSGAGGATRPREHRRHQQSEGCGGSQNEILFNPRERHPARIINGIIQLRSRRSSPHDHEEIMINPCAVTATSK